MKKVEILQHLRTGDFLEIQTCFEDKPQTGTVANKRNALLTGMVLDSANSVGAPKYKGMSAFEPRNNSSIMTAKTDGIYTVENYAKRIKRPKIGRRKRRLKNTIISCCRGKVNGILTQMSFYAKKSLATRKNTGPFSKDFQENKAVFQLRHLNYIIVSNKRTMPPKLNRTI